MTPTISNISFLGLLLNSKTFFLQKDRILALDTQAQTHTIPFIKWMQVKGTHGGVRHFIFVDMIMWPRISLSSCNDVFTETHSECISLSHSCFLMVANFGIIPVL